MPELPSPSAETIAGMAEQLVAARLRKQDVESVTSLVGALLDEMGPMRRLDVGSDEPATIYDPEAT